MKKEARDLILFMAGNGLLLGCGKGAEERDRLFYWLRRLAEEQSRQRNPAQSSSGCGEGPGGGSTWVRLGRKFVDFEKQTLLRRRRARTGSASKLDWRK